MVPIYEETSQVIRRQLGVSGHAGLTYGSMFGNGEMSPSHLSVACVFYSLEWGVVTEIRAESNGISSDWVKS